MTDLNCKDAKAHVYDFLAQELSEDLRESVNSHLKDCNNCAGEYAVELQISSFISSSSLNAVTTDELVNRAYAQIESEEEL